ncbi:elongation factor-like GTPase 1 [Onthophagus taurus]|uniref:elongation factor-like GTPase 1 n=1 Tax=Onthophagus taurus TaxID=166361 RepID=UPI000C200C12|nr:elongation factor-like GTPase 1 [Onthophagus taurus]XP_022908026.1 elongation factor-like GTPase 1 [Onthophagus taurus]
MQPNRPSTEILKEAMRNPSSIRNVCILAHIDHGKTTIADSLLSTNGLISKRSAGQVRYLDDRQDEQERGITMKCSAVSLYYRLKSAEMVLNLIDTPGHIDFSTEVSAAVRICDGALIVVDLVEGVCVQTRDAIKQAYDEHIKMILVLNKMDRLVLELHKSAELMFQTILRVIEDCNVIIAELCQYDAENIDDPDIYLFSPERGNVIFACATDGWGVTINSLSEAFFDLVVGETAETLSKKMWNFDCYIESETKKIVTGAIQKRKENVFIQLFLKTIYFLYYTFITRMQRDKLPLVLEKFKIKNPTRDMHHKDSKLQVKAILQTWSPIAGVIMQQCYDVIPSPFQVDEKKLNYLIYSNRYFENTKLNSYLDNMLKSMRDPQSKTSIVYVSKTFSVNKKNLSQNKAKVFIPPRNREELIKARKEQIITSDNKLEKDEETDIVKIDKTQDNVIVGLGRIFGGSLKKDDQIYVLDSDYDPLNSAEPKQITINELYLMLGRELLLTDDIPYGNIGGISGLDEMVLRTATLSSTPLSLPLNEHIYMEPIVRNTIEPVNPKDLPKLRQGLKYLSQSDSCVQVIMQESGEHVLVTAGDVHLAKCLEDLKSKFIDFDINVSKPMVSLRETIYAPKPNLKNPETTVKVAIEEVGITFEVIVVPIPSEIEIFLKNNYKLLQMIEENRQNLLNVSDHMKSVLAKLKNQMEMCFKSASDFWGEFSKKVWSVSRGRDSTNLLINNTDDYARDIFSDPDDKDPRSNYDHQIVNGFQICCRAGPICEEPLINCAFVITDYKISVPVGGQGVANIPLTVKNVLRDAFVKQEQRLVEPIFTTDIQVNVHVIGKVYSVLGRRHGRILEAVGMDQEERTFRVKAQIPVVESDGFANEIRKTTSGQANPTLVFSHYEIIDGDPYFEGEEDEDGDGEAFTDALRANKLMKEARRRKGLIIDEQVVIHAEKQRTLNKKK